jgi:hypothetical protein
MVKLYINLVLLVIFIKMIDGGNLILGYCSATYKKAEILYFAILNIE